MSKTLIFVSNHRSASRVADRMIGALAAHRRIELLSFDREMVDHPVYHDANVRHTSLGRIKGGVGLSRLYSFVRATWILARATRHIRHDDTVVLVNSLELLIISALCGLTRLPTVYDVSDIHPLQLSKSVVGRCMRWLERRTVRRVRLIVVTSPWFYWEYYRRWLRVPQAALLIENKVEPGPVNGQSRASFAKRIAWNGLLRCQTSAAVLLEWLTRAPDAVHLSLHGTLDRLGAFGPRLISLPNCDYTGLYTPETLNALILKSSFVWAIDFSEAENSKWLLPYRLYSAIVAGVPVIAAEGSATAEVVRRQNIGIVLSECSAPALRQALDSCNPEMYRLWLKNVHELRDRALRHDEWKLVFEDVSRWGALKLLPSEIDVDVVFRSEIVATGATDRQRSGCIMSAQAIEAATTLT
jgi:glycosyltransferase involved in cell wall biosynthesis